MGAFTLPPLEYMYLTSTRFSGNPKGPKTRVSKRMRVLQENAGETNDIGFLS